MILDPSRSPWDDSQLKADGWQRRGASNGSYERTASWEDEGGCGTIAGAELCHSCKDAALSSESLVFDSPPDLLNFGNVRKFVLMFLFSLAN